MSRVHYVHHPDIEIDLGAHVFPVSKYALLARALVEEQRVEPERLHEAEELGLADLLRVHTRSYCDDLLHARVSAATAGSELPVDARVIQGFFAMAGGSIKALRLALEHGAAFHVGGGLHHAMPDHAEGFCYVHDVAIAVERMRAEARLGRVLFVDTDVHQGNGTARIYAGCPRTFTYSIHEEDNYPPKERSHLDRGLAGGTGDAEYLDLLTRDLDEIDRHFEPDLLCYLAGVDPFEHDQLGGLALSRAGLERRDRLVLERYLGRGIPAAVFLAGGYARSPEETASLHMGTVRAAEWAAGRPSPGGSW